MITYPEPLQPTVSTRRTPTPGWFSCKHFGSRIVVSGVDLRHRNSHVTAQLIVFIEGDMDEEAVPDALRRLIAALDADPSVTSWLEVADLEYESHTAVAIPGGYAVTLHVRGERPSEDRDPYCPGEWEWLISRGIH